MPNVQISHREILNEMIGPFSQGKVMPDDEQRRLITLWKKGEGENPRQHFDAVVAANLRLVASRALKYVDKGLDLGDLIQEGSIGLMRGIKAYDLERDTKVSTCATKAIDNALRTALLHSHCKKHMVLTRARGGAGYETGERETENDALAHVADPASLPDQREEDRDEQREILSMKQYLHNLTPNQREVLALRMRRKSFSEVAHEMGKTEKQMATMHQMMIHQLRKNISSRLLSAQDVTDDERQHSPGEYLAGRAVV